MQPSGWNICFQISATAFALSTASVGARRALNFSTGRASSGAIVRILVTGGNGFIGSVVVRMLRARGFDVRCLVRRTSRLDRIAHLGCDLVVGDLLDFP